VCIEQGERSSDRLPIGRPTPSSPDTLEARFGGRNSVQDGAMLHCCAISMDIHIPESGSLKAKRRVVKHLVESCRTRFGVAASEVGHQDQWQRSELGFAAVCGSQGQVEEVLRTVERYVWSHPEIDVIGKTTFWLEDEG
jgi:uncharacterized protein